MINVPLVFKTHYVTLTILSEPYCLFMVIITRYHNDNIISVLKTAICGTFKEEKQQTSRGGERRRNVTDITSSSANQWHGLFNLPPSVATLAGRES